VESTEEVDDRRSCNEAPQHQESAGSDELRGAPVLNARAQFYPIPVHFVTGSCASTSSRTIEVDRLNLAGVTMHIQGDRAATDFAILNGGKRAGRCVDNCGEDRSAVGTNDS
jgi:hypothetical protein